jgi:Protein of unknown function (DUF3105)
MQAGPGSRKHVPVPALVVLALLLLLGPVAFAADGDHDRPPAPAGPPLAQIAREAGCELTEFQDGMKTNPPVTGHFVERARFADGSYVGRRQPSSDAAMHALLHGRVLFQYRPGTASEALRALDVLTRQDTHRVLLFENQTGMAAPVAATAYLSLMTCPRVDRKVLRALAAFRERRRGFGQDF